MNQRTWTLLEAVLVVLSIVGAVWAADVALDRALAQSALRSGELVRTAAEVDSARIGALVSFAVGALALFAGSLVGRARSAATAIRVPLLLPATILTAGLGFALQMGYGDPLRGPGWPGPGFAQGVLLGGFVGGFVLAAPWAWEEVADRARHVLLGGILVAFGALTLFGSGPEGTGTKINLLGFQPLELVKLAFVAYLAVFLGRRAAALRYQRNYLLNGLLRLPRPRLLFPALLALLVLFVGLFLVRDLGPILILGLTFLILFTVVTRSAPWALLAVGVVVAVVAVLAWAPDVVGSRALTLRMQMWLDPWTNTLANGDQLAASRWAIAAGGLWGQGVGAGFVGALPAGQNDLVLAHLAEELGFVGVLTYTGLLGTVVGSGIWIAMENRTPERVLFATGLSALLASQWFVIFGGTTGLLPLTGVIVPFLSAGRTSMVAFLVVVAFLGAMARDGRVRAVTDELNQLRGGVVGVGTGVLAALVLAVVTLFWEGVVIGPATTVRGVVTTLGDGTVVHRHDRRILAIARSVPRGEIRDRTGAPIAANGADGSRAYPLGTIGMGTLLGPADGAVLRPAWALERRHDEQLRGYPDREDGPSVWQALDGGAPRTLFATRTRDDRDRDRKRAERLADGAPLRQLPLPAPDFRPLVPVLHTRAERRPERIERAVGTLDDRSVRLTLDAGLQARAAEILTARAERGKAAAAVVIDVDTGEVLVRAQAPDLDLADREAWLRAVRDADPAFTGVYGPWSDLTGDRGILQAGSIGKIVTAVAAVREGVEVRGQGCDLHTAERWSCTERGRRGPQLRRPDWKAPIHDYYKDDPHGVIDINEAIAVSCNVTFAQVALGLGPEPYAELVRDGLQLGWNTTFRAGAPESRKLAETGFGQGATAMSVSQAARMVAMVGAGGRYRDCGSLELGVPCEEVSLVEDPRGLGVVLSGMRGTMTRGTGRGQQAIEGVRVYGKTGTADSIGLQDEVPYGMTFRREGYLPHSWFIALAEPESAPECSEASGRLAIAVVVPRSGTGAAVAAPTALDILRAAKELGYLDKRS